MFFYASKIVSALIWPSNVGFTLVVVGAALLWWGKGVLWARRMLAAGCVLLLAMCVSPLGHWMIWPLEMRFARPALPGEVTGIIMLGGFESGPHSRARDELSLNDAAERLTESLVLARRFPRAKVIFTGGEVTLLTSRADGMTSQIATFLEAVGVERSRIVVEGQSRTTYENALYLSAVMPQRPGERYLLVTSAFHMPRSVATFRKAGYDVIPWPVDYRTRGPEELYRVPDSVPAGLEQTDIAFKEWLGLVAYRLSGRTGELWPRP